MGTIRNTRLNENDSLIMQKRLNEVYDHFKKLLYMPVQVNQLYSMYSFDVHYETKFTKKVKYKFELWLSWFYIL